MDNLRAMREARYEQAMKRAGSAPARSAARPPVAPVAPAGAAARPAPKARAKRAAEPAAAEASTEELCGHRNMSGRTCTREKGHAAKSHRYS